MQQNTNRQDHNYPYVGEQQPSPQPQFVQPLSIYPQQHMPMHPLPSQYPVQFYPPVQHPILQVLPYFHHETVPHYQQGNPSDRIFYHNHHTPEGDMASATHMAVHTTPTTIPTMTIVDHPVQKEHKKYIPPHKRNIQSDLNPLANVFVPRF